MALPVVGEHELLSRGDRQADQCIANPAKNNDERREVTNTAVIVLSCIWLCLISDEKPEDLGSRSGPSKGKTNVKLLLTFAVLILRRIAATLPFHDYTDPSTFSGVLACVSREVA